MYTLNNTINDILADEVVMAHFTYMMPLEFIEMVPDELRDLPIKEVNTMLKMPWGAPFLGEGIVDISNRIHEILETDKYSFIQLWSDETPDDFFAATDGKQEHLGLLKLNESFKAHRKMALVVPGGAYMNVAISNEGMETAAVLEKAGYAVCITNYRCTPNFYPIPQKDLTLAIKCMRYLAKQYNLADDLLVIGFSAGGHLTASQACYHDEYNKLLNEELVESFPVLYERYKDLSARPDKVALSYPVISFENEQHEDSFTSLTGGDESLRNTLSIDLHVTADYPKTFVWACDDDDLLPPSNALRMYQALENAGVEVMYKAYPTGGHGCATGVGTSASSWMDEMIKFMND